MFNFQKSRVYFVITIILFSFLSCKQEDSVLKTTEKKSDFSDSDSKETILGQRLKNPYSVSVFREAQKNLKERSRISELVDVQATHYYVRFLPKDGVEFEELKKLDLVLFDYPMDYEIKTSGTHYHDPSVAENEITWQYCVVKTEFKFPQIQHEKLEELFLYTFEDKNANARTSVNQELYEILEQETFKLTGNEQEKKENARTTASCGGNWKPEATIKVFDDIKGLIPVQGVKVRFRRWFEAYEKPTDSYGVARCPAAFRREVNFAVIWETESGWFDLRHGNYGQASLNGPQQCGNWSYDFYKNSFYWPYGIAFNAAWYYYTQHSTFGIKQPPSDRGILKQRLHIRIHNSEFTSAHYFQFSRLWESAQIDLYYKDKVGYN